MKHRIVSVTDQSKHPLLIIVMLAWPIFVEQVLVSLVQSVDTAMVGALGANATASVSISQSPINLINSVIMALGVGFTTMIARAVGAKQFEYARKLIRQSIVVVFSLGIPLSVLCFVLSRQIPIWMGGAPEILDDAQSYIRHHRLLHAVPRPDDGAHRHLPRLRRQPHPDDHQHRHQSAQCCRQLSADLPHPRRHPFRPHLHRMGRGLGGCRRGALHLRFPDSGLAGTALYVFHSALRSNAHFDSRELPPQQRDHSGGFPGQLAGYV